MAQVDIGRVANGAPALQHVFVISRPDSKLLRSWSRSDGSQRDHAASLFGNLFRDCDRALETVGGAQQPRTLMVEASDRVVVVSRLAEKLSAAFVFEPSAPLGLIRVQARQLTAQLTRVLANGRSGSEAAPAGSAAMSERSPAFGIPVLPPPPPPFADPSALRGGGSVKSPAFGVPPAPSASSARRPPQSGRTASLDPRSPAFGVPPVTAGASPRMNAAAGPGAAAAPTAPAGLAGDTRSPAHGIPANPPRSPAHGVPAVGPMAGGPMNPRSPAHGVPAAAPVAGGPMNPRSPAHGMPAAGPMSSRSPAHGVPATSAMSPRSPAHGVPATSAMSPRSPAHGVPAAGPMSPRSPAHGVPATSAMNPRTPAHGLPNPDTRSPAHGIPSAGSKGPRTPGHGVPSQTVRSPAHGVPAASGVRTGGAAARDTMSGAHEVLAVRIATFAQNAADPRAALLRLSLRTGIAVELLRRPSTLTPEQSDLVSRALNELTPRST